MIRAQHLAKRFATGGGEVAALDDVSLEVPRGELLTLLGPSGCGKTTMLRSIAGLEEPDAGEIAIGERIVFSAVPPRFVPPNDRRIGMVFQSYAVWPHMSVYQNVVYPLRPRKLGAARERERVLKVLELVGLAEQVHRPAPLLSGGQQQRVALARALVAEPDVLLLDEPLSNLDAKLRDEMRVELRALQRRLGITAVYVTHDQAEALAISDQVALMSGGRIVEQATPSELYERPRSRFAAEFIGAANLIRVRIIPAADGAAVAEAPWGTVHLAEGTSAGADALLLIRPEDVELVAGDGGGPNVWDAVVLELTFLGARQRCLLRVGPTTTLVADLPRGAVLAPGATVRIRVTRDRCITLAE